MRKFWIVGLGLVVLVAIVTVTEKGQAREQKKGELFAQAGAQVQESLMRQKLDHAQQLLSALSLGDYQKMISNAKELQRISLEARWSQPQSPAYAQLGDEFRTALDRLIKSADKQNIDGAALNYVQVVLTCVQCHKVVREGEHIAKDFGPSDFGLLEKVARASAN